MDGSAQSPEGGRQSSVDGASPAFRRVSVVIPAKNEERNLGWVMRRMPIEVDEVILVDGNSSDRTVEVVLSIRADAIVVADRQPGKGSALRAGFAAATGDYVVMLDADGSMDPLEIDRFVMALDSGHDLAKGSRFLAGGGTADISPLRHLGHIALLTFTNILFQTRQTDLCYGYAAFRREAIAPLSLDAPGFEIESQLFLRAIVNGLSVTEVPSFEAPRRFGTSNLRTFRDGWRVLRSILRERLRPTVDTRESRPIRRAPEIIRAPESQPLGELVTSGMMSASIETLE